VKYTGCYKYYMPQDLCPQQDQKILGQWKCEFRNMFGLISWGAYQNEIWRETVLKELMGKELTDKNKYMIWLGQKIRYWEMNIMNMALIVIELMRERMNKLKK
jgi:hypothetical protein